MGSRGMRGDEGDEGDEGERSNVMPNAQCPMPNAQCPMPNAQFKILQLPAHDRWVGLIFWVRHR
ncbi:hypothetical protein [Nostoc sp.]